MSIGTDANVQIPILVSKTQLELRPPGTCGTHQQCGYLQLYVDGVLNNESSVTTIPLLLHKLADRYHDGSVHAATGERDLLTLRVDAVDSAGVPLNDHSGAPLTDSVKLMTLPSCDSPSCD